MFQRVNYQTELWHTACLITATDATVHNRICMSYQSGFCVIDEIDKPD